MSKSEWYRRYLQSSHWKNLREKVLKRAGGECEKQGCDRFAEHVHHLTYKRVGREKLKDLEALCIVCHQREHPEIEMIPGWGEDKQKHTENNSVDSSPPNWLRPKDANGFDCMMCPSEEADLFIGDYRLFFFCRKCGEPEIRIRAWKRSKMIQAKRKRNTKNRSEPIEDRKCPECGEILANIFGCKQHLWDKHGIKCKISKNKLTKYRQWFDCPFCSAKKNGIIDHIEDKHNVSLTPEELEEQYGITMHPDFIQNRGY